MTTALKPLTLLFLLALAIAAFLAIQSAYAQPSPHAIAGHATEPDMIRRCLDDYGPDAVLYNKCTCRTAFCVFVNTLKRWGIWIEADDGANVTSFVKTKMNRLDQVIRYLNNAGYE